MLCERRLSTHCGHQKYSASFRHEEGLLFTFLVPLLIGSAAVPPAGFDCDKARIDGRLASSCEDKLGHFVDAKRGPIIDQRATVLVRYEPSWGTNIYVEEVALLQQHADGYRTLWRHSSIEASGGLKHLGASDEATVYKWN